MCQPRGSQRMWDSWGSGCGCCCYSGCGCGTSFRRFISRKEELERLEEYKDQLKKEVEGVEEHISELKKK